MCVWHKFLFLSIISLYTCCKNFFFEFCTDSYYRHSVLVNNLKYCHLMKNKFNLVCSWSFWNCYPSLAIVEESIIHYASIFHHLKIIEKLLRVKVNNLISLHINKLFSSVFSNSAEWYLLLYTSIAWFIRSTKVKINNDFAYFGMYKR